MYLHASGSQVGVHGQFVFDVETWCLLQRGIRTGCLHLHGQFVHVAAGCRDERSVWSSGIGRVVRPYVYCEGEGGTLGESKTSRTAKHVPNVPCQMFAPGEAQVAGREVCAEEALSLLLLGRPV